MLYPSHWVPGEYRVGNPNRQPFDIVKAALADFQVKTAGTGKALVPWLQDFSLGHPYGAAEVRAQIDAAGELGVTDWLLWNATARYTSGGLDPARVRLRR
ncbi:MAG: putative glycoside hydrolase, partial [Actinobacteria bacterium]|nr:putative glycoside hydrolase [Actinomycetota bacterium]